LAHQSSIVSPNNWKVDIMAERPDTNDRFPLRESLSPPLIAHPVFECAEAVYVTGFMAHARVRVFANVTELLAEEEPPFGFATITLKRPVKAGESLTATQEVDNQTSPHSLIPVIVQPLDGDRVKNTKPDIVEPLYECGRVVPVANLVPSTRLHVMQDGAEIGLAAVAQAFHAVLTQPLKAGSQVSAVMVACEGSNHEIKGPQSDFAAPPPLAAPSPPPAPVVDAASLIPGNDAVTLTGLLVGAGVEIFDQGNLVSSGWFATAGANWFPVDKRLSSNPITATQELCGKVSPPSAPVVPEGRLEAPQVLQPICGGARFVVIRGSTINATVVVLRNGQPMTHGGAAPGDLVLQLGQNTALNAGDVVEALQYMNGTISPTSTGVTVSSGLGEPSVEILGGDPFFLPKANEEPIHGPVFPRGRGPGPTIRIQACCTREVKAWITGPRGDHITDLVLDQLYPGYYQASWPWSASSGWRIPDEIPVGEYTVHVHSACQEREAATPFYVVFDPAAVGGPQRFSFDPTAVWFATGHNNVQGLHYYLHCSDWRVFRIAIQAISGHTVPYDAAIAAARAEEGLFNYSLDYHTNDVADLVANYSEAQCADDAACLTALLRASGIPAHPVTADAGLETGAAYWTFDTWVEFLADHDGSREWRIFHPHEYPGMQPEPRGVFGGRGVASKGFNDLIIMANESWMLAQLDDGSDDVNYSRNECGEPNQMLTKAPWIDELCESGYWTQAHWDCAGVRVRSLTGGEGFRLSSGETAFGGRLSGTVHLLNRMEDRNFGRLVVELVTSRLESKSFIETSLQAVERHVAVDPGGAVTLPFDFTLPPTLAPGRELYLRARLDERSALIMPVRLPSCLRAKLDMPRLWQEGAEATIRLLVHNAGDFALRDVSVRIKAPYALKLARQRDARLDVLAPGEEREVTFTIRAVAALTSGSLHVAIASANGGGLMLRRPFRVEGRQVAIEAWPGLRLLE
jgi:transglutaminase-like putative cysteine protease